MADPIEFDSTCSCESWCDGSICWLPAQRELARLLVAWRLRNPSPTYRITSDAARLDGAELRWDPARRKLWDVLAAPGRWRQSYLVEEERIRVSQVLRDGTAEAFVVAPTVKTVPILEPAPSRAPALIMA